MSNYNDLEMKVEDKSENSKATKRHLVSMLKENEEADDSLDIKPPQASVVHRHKKSSSRSSSKRRKHSSKDGGRRKHIHDKPETSSSRKTHHRTREHREHSRELLREKKYHRRCHREAARFREKKHERKHEHDVSSSAGGYSHDSGPELELDGDRRSRSINKLSDSYADQVLEDFRKHLLDKRSNNRHSEGYTERYNSDDVDIYGGSDQRSKVEQSKEDRERDCELRIMTQSTILMSAQREISHEKAECLEKEMKRERFLKAEREMMQEKEVYQCERREHQCLGKEKQNILREISQERECRRSREMKKPGMKEEDDEINRSTYRNESSTDSSHGVVAVSDDLTEEKLQARKVAVCRGKAKTDNTDNCRPADEEENVLSETDEEDNGSTESEEDETADTTSGSHHTDNETTPVNGLTGNEDAASATKPVEKLSEDEEEDNGIPFITAEPSKLDFVMNEELPPYLPAIQGCRSVEEFITLNKIEEGSYGVVFRAKDKHTEEIVALKKLKIDKEKDGFPITSLREISTLLKAQHPNIVTIREIVVGDNMNKIFIVMDYVEHDLKSLMGTMKQKNQFFLPGEVKCLMQQLLRAVAHLHDNWILHRDLKTSNLLLSHRGILKVGDFGLAREYGSPLKPYTSLVVTRWYRAPELLLGAKKYSTPVDMWSVGCIFGEFLLMEALFQGKSDIEQLKRVFKALGTPNDKIWPEFSKLPIVQKVKFAQHPVNQLRRRFDTMISDVGMDLMNRFLTYDPAQRISAEDALLHDYFREAPLPIDPMMFPTWPAKSELGHKNAVVASPRPLRTGHGDADEDVPTEGFHMGLTEKGHIDCGPAFRLKF